MKLIFTLLALTLALILHSCKEDKPSDPGPEPEPEDTTTTSHDFHFTNYTLGDGASMLNNVAILNDTCAYAVGLINLLDSTGEFVLPPYNLARWDGKKWNLERVYFRDASNNYYPDEASAMLIFSETDIVVSSGPSVMHWDGMEWKRLGNLISKDGWQIGSPELLWGRSSSDFYGVGGRGSIVHWNGSDWEKINSGTSLWMQDIWGAYNPKTGKDEILCLASEKDTDNGKRLMRIEGKQVSVVDSTGLANQLSGIWFTPNKRYYAVGAGVHWKQPFDSPQPWKVFMPGTVTSYYSNAIRGNAQNDVVIAGAFSEIVHFNGKTWQNYRSSGLKGSYLKVAMKGNLIIGVGYGGQRGAIVVGMR